MTDYSKLDTALTLAVHSADSEPELKETRLTVLVDFEGTKEFKDLLSDAGLEVFTVEDGSAAGIIKLSDLSALTLLDWVLYVSTGQEPTLDLDEASPDVKARASDTALTDGLWHAEVSTGVLTPGTKSTGKGVIVAIIDTGIDYAHPMFLSQVKPDFKSRILRIWDMGLTAPDVNKAPDKDWLASPNTYGREFKTAEIETALNGKVPLGHKDCSGHGTHCAGIATGGPVFAKGGKAKWVGVAPEADIVAVKFLDLPKAINYFGTADPIDHNFRFRDAVKYCLRFAKSASKPIVISMSFGNSHAVGDGLDKSAIWIDKVLDPTKPAGDENFPRGAIAVTSAGNNGRTNANRHMARIVVPDSGKIVVPMKLQDKRGGEEFLRENCINGFYSPSITSTFWYKRATPPTAVKFSIKVPGRPTSIKLEPGDFLNESYKEIVGPPKKIQRIPSNSKQLGLFAKHNQEPQVAVPAHAGGGFVHRHSFQMRCRPRKIGHTASYLEGLYEVHIDAPKGTEIFLYCGSAYWNGKHDGPSRSVKVSVGTKDSSGNATSAGITFEKKHTSVDTLGLNAITVSAYDERMLVYSKADDLFVLNPNHRDIASFSSHGPLRFFGNALAGQTPIAEKPDIAAPGRQIHSAQSINSKVTVPKTACWKRGDRFVDKGGTSMATPMVAGAVAILLEKNPNLITTQVRDHLAQSVRAAVPEDKEAYGAGMLDAKAARERLPE